MSDPQKSYHLEFVCTDEDKARQLQSVIRGFDIEAKIVLRKKYYVVYLEGRIWYCGSSQCIAKHHLP